MRRHEWIYDQCRKKTEVINWLLYISIEKHQVLEPDEH